MTFRLHPGDFKALRYMAEQEEVPMNKLLIDSLHMHPRFFKYKVELEVKKEKEERENG